MIDAQDINDDLKIELYKVAIQTRNMEIHLFWQRSNYFLALNTAIAVGFFTLKSNSRLDFILLGCLGLFICVLWFQVTCGSKFWATRWERRLQIVENSIRPRLNLFSADWQTVQQDVAEGLQFTNPSYMDRLLQRWILKKPSVTRAMMILSLAFGVFWIAAVAIKFMT